MYLLKNNKSLMAKGEFKFDCFACSGNCATWTVLVWLFLCNLVYLGLFFYTTYQTSDYQTLLVSALIVVAGTMAFTVLYLLSDCYQHQYQPNLSRRTSLLTTS